MIYLSWFYVPVSMSVSVLCISYVDVKFVFSVGSIFSFSCCVCFLMSATCVLLTALPLIVLTCVQLPQVLKQSSSPPLSLFDDCFLSGFLWTCSCHEQFQVGSSIYSLVLVTFPGFVNFFPPFVWVLFPESRLVCSRVQPLCANHDVLQVLNVCWHCVCQHVQPLELALDKYEYIVKVFTMFHTFTSQKLQKTFNWKFNWKKPLNIMLPNHSCLKPTWKEWKEKWQKFM